MLYKLLYKLGRENAIRITLVFKLFYLIFLFWLVVNSAYVRFESFGSFSSVVRFLNINISIWWVSLSPSSIYSLIPFLRIASMTVFKIIQIAKPLRNEIEVYRR